MHAYTITAMPGRRQRAIRAIRRWVPRLLVATGLVLLGASVFLLRAARALIGLAATIAARIEYAAAAKAGKPPLGQALGVGIAEAFTAEFTRTRTDTAA